MLHKKSPHMAKPKTAAKAKAKRTTHKTAKVHTKAKRAMSTEAPVSAFAHIGEESNVTFPKPKSERVFPKKVPMPFSRGQAWGQVLVSNQELPTPAGTWTPQSIRSAVTLTKVGMVSVFDQFGVRHGVTVLDIDDCQVTAVHPKADKYGKIPMEVGGHDTREKGVTKPLLGHFHKARVQPKRNVHSFPVTPDAVLPVGWRFDVRHFMVGQYIDVYGVSKGKGFAGVMKRYGFGGQPATHGVSVTHRSLGSTGQRQDPGKVFKLKKMPGHMGVNNVFFENIRIMKIDPQKQLIFVKGMIPGPAGSHVLAKDAQKKPFAAENPPPFPTFVPPADDAKEMLIIPTELLGPDPYANGMVM